jgi:Family of unknown function (DUF5984)
MLFDFSLRPLKEISPWGEAPNSILSWFGFTDGSYRLKVGSNYLLNYSTTQLLNYSDNYIKRFIESSPTSHKESFVDYQVVRLWEDILAILPNVLELTPKKLCSFLEMSDADWNSWQNKAVDWEEDQVKSGFDEDNAFTIFNMAVELRRSRCLDSGYLRNSPSIWMWSTDSTVNISWDNQNIVDEGINVWSALRGNHCMSRAEFLDEVHAFHEKLFFEMGQRVEAICNHWDRSEIKVDTEHLKYEQKDRATWLEYALSRTTLSKPEPLKWQMTYYLPPINCLNVFQMPSPGLSVFGIEQSIVSVHEHCLSHPEALTEYIRLHKRSSMRSRIRFIESGNLPIIMSLLMMTFGDIYRTNTLS